MFTVRQLFIRIMLLLCLLHRRSRRRRCEM
jgi:hypothetical protein